MANELTPNNKALSKQISINPQSYLEIEGLSTIFGAQPVLEFIEWDSDNIYWDDDAVRWDGLIARPDSKAVISLNESTKNITQQIFPDKGGSSSLPSVNIALVDLNNEIAQILSFDNLGELLGRKADYYIGFKQGAFPSDAIPVYRGVISDTYTQNGIIMVTVSHPENLKRQAIFQKYISTTTALITDVQTILPVVSTIDIIPNQDVATTLFRIEDEIVELVSIDSGTQITVIRARENTFAVEHDDESDIESIQQLTGEPIPLALKLMLSTEGNEYFNSFDIPKAVNFISVTAPSIPNSFIFDYYDIQLRTGLVTGDLIQINSGTNTGLYTIKTFGILTDGSFITVNETLLTENSFVGDFTYKSQFNLLPDGLGMLPTNVDVISHLDIVKQFPSNFVPYKFQLKDTIDNCKEFLDQQVYFPQGLYTINRSARSSVKIVTPPFSSDIVPTINVDNILNISEIRQRRSLHKYLYNIIRYDYNPDILEDKFLTKNIILSNESLNRIKGGKKQMKIESHGLIRGTDTLSALDQITQRVIDRYKFAPTYFEKVQIKYSSGFNLEVGDVLPFGGLTAKIINLDTGKRGTKEQLFEVINKSLNIETGDISVDLLSTSFSIRSRNSVVSLSSGCGVSSTTTRIEMTTIVDSGEYVNEAEKWQDFIGQNVRVFKNDYTEDETVVLKAIDPSDDNFMVVEPALSFTPNTGHIIGIPEYNNTDENIDSAYKLQFAHWTAQVIVSAVIDNQSFEVSTPDKLVVGSEIYIHDPLYVSRDSFTGETKFTIVSIVTNTVTLDKPLSFIPQIGDAVEFSDFLDGGFPFSII